ncbi:MAG: hypothetical protein E7280_08585 [Lachnospiraceae bacterium]|nr:hypothetical protein [Lachnospiraceae bacterium]
MKKIKRGLSILLAVAMVLSGVMVPGEKAKADVQTTGTEYVITLDENGNVYHNDIEGQYFYVKAGDIIKLNNSIILNRGNAIKYWDFNGEELSGETWPTDDVISLQVKSFSDFPNLGDMRGCWYADVVPCPDNGDHSESKIEGVWFRAKNTEVQINSASFKNQEFNVAGITGDQGTFYMPGDVVTLGGLQPGATEGNYQFDGVEYAFGETPTTYVEALFIDEMYRIPTEGHDEPLTIRAKWKSTSTPIYYEPKVTRYPIRFNEVSFRGTKTPEGVPTSYEPGEVVSLAGVTEEVTGFAFGGYSYSFGGGAKQEATKGADGTYSISTAGENGTLTIYAVWIPDSCDVTYDPNEAQLKTVNENAKLKEGEKAVTFEKQKKEDKIRKDAFANEDKTIEMTGWSFDPKADKPDISLKDAENMTVGEMMALYERNGGDTSREKVTLYANWAYKKFKITYVGVDYTDLQTTYTAKDQITLPDVKTMNERMALPKDSLAYGRRFTMWSKDRYSYKPVRTLGKDGDIKSGDVTLYAITVPETVADYSMDMHAGTRKYQTIQDNALDIYDKKSYALIYFTNWDVNADPDRITLDNPYYEIVPLDKTMADYENGFACVAVRVKDSLKNSDLKEAEKNKNKRLHFQVPALYDRESIEVVHSLEVNKEYPTSPVDKKQSFAIYEDFLPEKDSVVNFTSYVNMSFFTDSYSSGEWELAYVEKKKGSYVVKDGITPTLNTGKSMNFMVDTAKIKKSVYGYVRIHNKNWIDGYYLYAKQDFSVLKKGKIEGFDTGSVTLNNGTNKEKAEVRLIIARGMPLAETNLELSKITLTPKKNLPEGLTVELNGDTITATCEKGTPKGRYTFVFSGAGIGKNVFFKVDVVDTAPDKAIKFDVRGVMDAEFGGKIFVRPSVKTFSGTIENAFIKDEAVDCPYSALWDEKNERIEIFTNEHFKPRTKFEKVTLAVTLSTGVVLYSKVPVSFRKGKLQGTALNTILFTKRDSYAKSPVILYYTEWVSIGFNKMRTRIRFLDLRKEEVRSLFSFGKLSFGKNLEGEFTDGVFVIKYEGVIKEKKIINENMKIKLTGIGAKIEVRFMVTVDPSTTP